MPTSSVNLNSPFAQALISEGQKRGYSPIAIAASIGNASQENGLRTNGAPGDGGTAFGAFQWRGDRYQNLQRTASAMDKAWDDPQVQAAHWYNELDGKYGGEKPYGDALKAARNPQEANDAVIQSLRPAGSQNGPQAAHNYSGRLSAVQEAFGLLADGQGNLNPSATSPQASSNDPQTTGSVQQAPQSGWDAFLSGGPGAFFGQPQQGWNIGDALMGAGAAMMARDNPKGTEALLRSMAAVAQQKDPEKLHTQINAVTGRAYVTDSKGNVQVKQIHPADAKPISETAMKLIQANSDAAETAWSAAEGTRRWTQMLMNGKVNLSALSRIGNEYANFTNDSDEGTRNAAGFMAHLMKMRDARLLEAKGVQTEGDANRALEALLPGNSKYDNKAAATLFRDLSRDFTNTYDQKERYNQGIMARYKDYDPEGFYHSRYNDRMKQARDADALIEKGWGDFTKPPAAPVVTSGTAPTGRDPVKVPGKPKESFLEFFNRRTAQ